MKTYLLLILFLATNSLFAQYEGPIPAIATGYGSEGPNSVSVTNISNDHFFLKDISVFYPTGTITPLPTLYFLHGYGGNDTTNYIETLRNLASNGYVVVFVPYKSIAVDNTERYLTIYDGFVKASQTLTSIIDTTRVGFFGHSFGGGATPRISYRLFTENNWGANGKFIYCAAPWYSFELGNSNLDNFPTDCKMLTVLYDKDDVNDHRMGMDIFNNIAIDDSIKDCIIVYEDIVSGYTYKGDHSLPAQYSANGSFDAHDYYVTFRFLNALASYTFTGDLTAKDIALGNGSATQINMDPQLTPLYVTDSPSPIYAEDIYTNPCTDATNERQDFCLDIIGINESNNTTADFELYPNPTNSVFSIRTEQTYSILTVSVYNVIGQKLFIVNNQTNISLKNHQAGTYFVEVNIDGAIEVIRIIKTK